MVRWILAVTKAADKCTLMRMQALNWDTANVQAVPVDATSLQQIFKQLFSLNISNIGFQLKVWKKISKFS